MTNENGRFTDRVSGSPVSVGRVPRNKVLLAHGRTKLVPECIAVCVHAFAGEHAQLSCEVPTHHVTAVLMTQSFEAGHARLHTDAYTDDGTAHLTRMFWRWHRRS